MTRSRSARRFLCSTGHSIQRTPSLPGGFSKDKIRAFYERSGGKASELWPQSWQVVRFTAARLKGGGFVGVEEHLSGKDWGLRLRVSNDLAHWSDAVAIPHEQTSEGWDKGFLRYPVFSDAAGQAADEVDPSGFFILGAQAGGKIVRQKISIELTP